MSWIVGIEQDFLNARLRLTVGRAAADETFQVVTAIKSDQVDGWSTEYQTVQHNEIPPKLLLDESLARALLDALTKHFHGASDVRQLRKDYDAERARVDVLMSAMMHIATPNTEAVRHHA